MGQFQTTEFRQLAREACSGATRLERLQQLERAEAVATQIVFGGNYSPAILSQQIASEVDSPEELTANSVVSGELLLNELRLFIEMLSAEDLIDVDMASEPVWTVQDLADRFGVSAKTVERWRTRGLISRRFRQNGRSRIGFLDSSVRRFAKSHSAEIERGRRFTQMAADEKYEIIRQARELARHDICVTEIGRRLGGQFGRSPETIRYTLQQHDSQHPESAVFPTAIAPLSADQKRDLHQKFKRGVPVERLAKQFGRTKATIYRVINEVRAANLLSEPSDHMDSPEFHERHPAAAILVDAPVVVRKTTAVRPPTGLPPYLASLYAIPLLTREEEQYYFRKMNFLKFRAAALQQAIDPKRPKTSDLDDLERDLRDATEIKNFLIRSNLRLVVSIAKKHIKPTNNFFEMVSDGNMSLIRAIEKFDYTKGNKFSTYATWAIMKNFARSIPAEHKRLDRFRTGKEEVFQHSTDWKSNPYQEEMTNRRQHGALMGILHQLDNRERDIIMFRFGLGDSQEPLTLEQVGHRFGVTKERIRQLESRALRKLRKIAEDEKLDVPGIE